MHTGKVIKILRKEKELTQDQLSEVLGVKKSSIQKYESGAVSNLKMETIKKLCQYFDVPPWMFVFPELLRNEEDVLNFRQNGNLEENLDFAFSLNSRGVRKVLDYAKDLIDSGNYKSSR